MAKAMSSTTVLSTLVAKTVTSIIRPLAFVVETESLMTRSPAPVVGVAVQVTLLI